jgi:hypothetical protein
MSLREIQSKVADWICAPEGIEKALADDPKPQEARARLNHLIKSDSTLAATARLEIYANAYFYRLLGVLAEDYEALKNGLGDALFNDLVTSYLLVEPSRHPSLRYAGARLPHFVASHSATSGLRARAPWAADLARLEWARVNVFDADDGIPMTRDSLSTVAPEAFASIPLNLGPWMRAQSFDFAVDDLWRTGMRDEQWDPGLVPTPVHLLIWRRDERVRHRRIDPLEALALEWIGNEAATTFGSLCEWTAAQIDESEAPMCAAGWLEKWLADGLFFDRTQNT